MQELISVRLSGYGTPFPLAGDAHAPLQRYLQDARSSLGEDPDRDEIVRDLEAAVGERLAALSPTTEHPVTAEQMHAVLADVGPVGAPHRPRALNGAHPARGRFWCRIAEGKWFGGISLGIAAYGDFRVDWVRTVILLLTLATGGFLGVVYLSLLLVLPVVPNVAEYERRRDAPLLPGSRPL